MTIAYGPNYHDASNFLSKQNVNYIVRLGIEIEPSRRRRDMDSIYVV